MHNQVEHKTADIILMPYNYLLNQSLRQQIGMSLTNKVVIIDEGHNITQAAEEVVDMEVTVPDLNMILKYELLPLLKVLDVWQYKQMISKIYRPAVSLDIMEENPEVESRYRKRLPEIKTSAEVLMKVIRYIVGFRRSLDDMSFFIP